MTEATRLLRMVEGLSKIVFHYTSFHSLYSILQSNEFRMVNSVNPGSAERLVQPGAVFKRGEEGKIQTHLPTETNRAAQKHYYFCVARSPVGKYQGVHTGAVEIVLDGDKLAQRYQAAPVDYWGDEFRKHSKGEYEMEDRIYSKTPTIPNAISYMKEIHILWQLRKDESDYPYPRFSREGIGKEADMLRRCWLIAKQNGVGFYV